jgi:hypothetical protein
VKATQVAVRTILVIDFVLFGLSFWPRFEGSPPRQGFAEQLFGNLTLGGFRCDFVWLVLSTLVVLIAAVFFKVKSRKNSGLENDAYFCIAWVVAFVVYLVKAVVTGELYFG